MLLVAAACSPLSLVDELTPTDGYKVYEDISYGQHHRQKLDLYVPDKNVLQAPVVIFFYGGGWTNGSKSQYRFVAQALTQCGFVAVIPDYRLYPEVIFPAFIEDGAEAVGWVQSNVSSYGGNSKRFFLMGHSAGAHTAAMLALNPYYLNAVGVDQNSIRALVGLSGPYDFLPLGSRILREVFGTTPDLSTTQPINYVTANSPEALLIHGGYDSTVRVQNSKSLAAALKANDVETKLIIIPQVGHAPIIGDFARPLRFLNSAYDEVTDYLLQQSHVSAGTCGNEES